MLKRRLVGLVSLFYLPKKAEPRVSEARLIRHFNLFAKSNFCGGIFRFTFCFSHRSFSA